MHAKSIKKGAEILHARTFILKISDFCPHSLESSLGYRSISVEPNCHDSADAGEGAGDGAAAVLLGE